jgi:hypothetical protein
MVFKITIFGPRTGSPLLKQFLVIFCEYFIIILRVFARWAFFGSLNVFANITTITAMPFYDGFLLKYFA